MLRSKSSQLIQLLIAVRLNVVWEALKVHTWVSFCASLGSLQEMPGCAVSNSMFATYVKHDSCIPHEIRCRNL
jgi:hypothetical protein